MGHASKWLNKRSGQEVYFWRQNMNVGGGNNQVGRKSAIYGGANRFSCEAEVRLAGAAVRASTADGEIGFRRNSLAGTKTNNTGAKHVNFAGDFVAKHDWGICTEFTPINVDVCTTESCRPDPYSNLVRLWLRLRHIT
jgi:hypothetical protein